MSMLVRPATPADAPRVVEIYVDSWNAGFTGLMAPIEADAGRIQRWAADLASDRTNWWVAEADGTVAGLVGIGPSRDPLDPRLGELDTIAIDPAYWRTGVGTTLMHTALDALRAAYPQAILWTLANYPQGQRFYESTGWYADGTTRDNGHQVMFRHDLDGG
ncbi:GNAT family N-acetyltransferase [Kribbella capetownensis]|uniref:GNAT family N-acetyltransferase n=2 Tax=Kribbella capetownensis TaxID=1572659 RepID=A0A4R0JI84_9ACTN|nr:GNAT family N-acetyltransferase [Kribbella capetownensis]